LAAYRHVRTARRTSRPSSAATKPLIGFGNPLLDGDPSDVNERLRAKLAQEKQSCSKTAWQRIVAVFGLHRGLTPIDMRTGLADVSLIRTQAPLPESADELCAVASNVGADVKELRLGARATEHEVKALSRGGELAHYRIVHFATHGAMAGS
jgi:CHAT domain-containing protein